MAERFLVEAVNDAIAIYSKTGTLLASFTENNLWSGVGTSPCNGNSQGDPIVIYDWLADRFVITWFALALRSRICQPHRHPPVFSEG